MIDYVVNELLCILKNKHEMVPRATIVTILSDFYNQKEVNDAKLILTNVADKSKIKIDEIKKIKSHTGDGKLRRDIEDICVLYAGLVNKDVLPLFLASDTDRIPCFDSADVKKSLDVMSGKLSDKMDEISSSVTNQVTNKVKKLNMLINNAMSDSAKDIASSH